MAKVAKRLHVQGVVIERILKKARLISVQLSTIQ